MSDVAWTCELATGGVSLWELVSAAMVVVGIAVGALVYVVVERGMARVVKAIER